MDKVIKQIKITTAEFTTKEIPGTGFSKWYMKKTTDIRGLFLCSIVGQTIIG